MATLLDSSVLVAALHTNDALHAKADATLTKAEKPFLIPEYVVLETATVLMRRAGKPIADEFLSIVRSYQDFDILPSSESLFQSTIDAFVSSSGKLSFVDCTLLVLSAEHTLLTFDEALLKVARRKG